MDKNVVLLTQSGFDHLKEELDNLINVVRPEVIRELAEARAQGDLSENADYDAARDRQRDVEAQIQQYQFMIDHAEIIEGGNVDTVRPGVTVTYHDLADNVNDEVTIVGTFETDPKNGKISNNCPLAEAMMDHREGERVTVAVAEPYEIYITKIEIKDSTQNSFN